MTNKKTKAKKIHKHKWITEKPCFDCGSYQAYCNSCEAIAWFTSDGKMVNIY